MNLENFHEIVDAHFDDIQTFIDVHRGEIEELFETGSVTLTYPDELGNPIKFVVSLMFNNSL